MQITLEYRLEVVQYCIACGFNYGKTALAYGLSYHLVYAWLKKYRERGFLGLKDGRGRNKANTAAPAPSAVPPQITEELLRELESAREELSGNCFSELRFEAEYTAISRVAGRHGRCISRLCAELGVSRSAYYKWLKHEISGRELENKMIAQWIKEYDRLYKHTLGYRRMCAYINRRHCKSYGKRRIYRLMRLLGIHSLLRRKKKPPRESAPCPEIANLLRRDFNAKRPNEKWTTDVTILKYAGGSKMMYLSMVLDLYDRSVVSYALAREDSSELVRDTFRKAVEANPDARPLFHSDRGFQYTEKTFRDELEKQGMRQSMSRAGRCIDNAPIEGLWSLIKAELRPSLCKTEAELRDAVAEYVRYYNCERYQARFGNKAPMEVRNAALAAEFPAQYPIAENKRIKAYWLSLRGDAEKGPEPEQLSFLF